MVNNFSLTILSKFITPPLVILSIIYFSAQSLILEIVSRLLVTLAV